MKSLILLFLIIQLANGIEIIQKPIEFSDRRVDLTKDYILNHYNFSVKDINIIPQVLVIHHTGINNLKDSFNRLKNEILFADRKYISKASPLNVSAHFLVDRDGTIYQLMPENQMARHVIGLNYSSIGIENVGGEDDIDNLTSKQLTSNIKLIKYLQKKYTTIKYLIGHFEYRNLEKNSLWLEKDKHYRTIKSDPSKEFMSKIRKSVTGLKAF